MVSTIARRHGTLPSLLFTWRRAFQAGVSKQPEAKFVSALIVPEALPDELRPSTADRVEIVARNGRRLIIDASLDVATIARLIAVAERR